jgi:hypothetical protein
VLLNPIHPRKAQSGLGHRGSGQDGDHGEVSRVAVALEGQVLPGKNVRGWPVMPGLMAAIAVRSAAWRLRRRRGRGKGPWLTSSGQRAEGGGPGGQLASEKGLGDGRLFPDGGRARERDRSPQAFQEGILP